MKSYVQWRNMASPRNDGAPGVVGARRAREERKQRRAAASSEAARRRRPAAVRGIIMCTLGGISRTRLVLMQALMLMTGARYECEHARTAARVWCAAQFSSMAAVAARACRARPQSRARMQGAGPRPRSQALKHLLEPPLLVRRRLGVALVLLADILLPPVDGGLCLLERAGGPATGFAEMGWCLD